MLTATNATASVFPVCEELSWLNMVERLFRNLSEKALTRSLYHVNDLIGAITEYVNVHSQSPQPFIWTATANDALAKAKRTRRAQRKASEYVAHR